MELARSMMMAGLIYYRVAHRGISGIGSELALGTDLRDNI